MKKRGTDREKRPVITRNFLKRLAKGIVKSIPFVGGLFEEMIFGTLEGKAGEKQRVELLGALNDIRQHVQGHTVDEDTALKRAHNLPPRNEYFRGREDILRRVREALEAGGTAGLTQVHGISGLGGIGKSQTALEYAYRQLEVDYDVAVWVRADTDSELIGGFIEAARLLGLLGEGPQKDEDLVKAVRAWFKAHERWLLILDNVEGDRQDAVKKYIPRGDGGHVLITSRAAQLDLLGVPKPIALDKMEPDEARLFLYDRTKRDKDTETDAVDAIAEALGYLPLALEQAAAYIIAKDCRFAVYRKSFEKHRKEFLRHKPVAGDYPESVATTWSMNFKQVAGTSATSADLLRFAAFLDPDRIPFELVRQGARRLGLRFAIALFHVKDDPIVLNDVLEPLERYSLIRVDREDDSFSIHRLVQQAVRDQLKRSTQRKWAKRTVRAVNAAFPDPEFKNWRLCERLLPHAHAAITLIETHSSETGYAAHLLHQTAYFLYFRGRYTAAEPLWLCAVTITERALGPDHAELATSLGCLANLYRVQGRYAEAEPLYQRALDIYERALRPDHPNLGTMLNGLATLYEAQDRYADAEPLYQRALDIYERALGPDHPNLATTLNNLAGLYLTQGRYDDAEPLYQRALEIEERVLGADHPSVAITLNNLANLYKAQGRYADAEPLHQRALAILEEALPADHPNLAITLWSLAVLYKAQERYDDAEPLYQRALAILEEALPADHPNLAKVYANYADLLRTLGRDAEAGEYEARSAAIIEKRANK